ncbi:MAG: cell division protein FtsZ [Granulosicoccus sp.]
MFELVDSINDAPVIKLIGVGGGGSNAVQHMVDSGIEGVDFICANTDAQALKSMGAQTVLHIGQSITKGLGAGANPEIGRQAAMEDRDRIQDLIEGTDMLFITAGMGGGTGTGAIPVVAQIAREMGVLTVAVVTKPFPFEGAKRMGVAEQGIEELRGHVDSLITIPNEKLLSVLGKNITMIDAFRAANDVLRGAVQGIAELITNPGLINVDFADVRTVMSEMGLAMMGSGIGRGDERATEAAEMAISSPLLEDIDLSGARGILVNITAGLDMAIGEFEEVGNVVRQFAAEDATIVVGTAIDEALEGELRVTVVATGLGHQQQQQSQLRTVQQSVQQPRVAAAGGGLQYGTAGNAATQYGSHSGATAGGATAQYGGSTAGGAPHYNSAGSQYANYDKPTVIRKTARGVASGTGPASSGHDVEYLDIPAFLRRQAD